MSEDRELLERTIGTVVPLEMIEGKSSRWELVGKSERVQQALSNLAFTVEAYEKTRANLYNEWFLKKYGYSKFGRARYRFDCFVIKYIDKIKGLFPCREDDDRE